MERGNAVRLDGRAGMTDGNDGWERGMTEGRRIGAQE